MKQTMANYVEKLYYYNFYYGTTGMSLSEHFETVEECKQKMYEMINDFQNPNIGNTFVTGWKILKFNYDGENIIVESKQLMEPKEYKCETCGRTNAKMWRDYGGSTLLCVVCTLLKTGLEHVEVDADGRRDGTTDQLGGYLPAVQVVPGFERVWGYTSVPEDRVIEWRKLPTL
jgi:hypothetical protein